LEPNGTGRLALHRPQQAYAKWLCRELQGKFQLRLAMEAIELDNTGTLRGVLPKDYGRPSFDRQMIGDFGGFILQHQNA
jgi:hypothetical protein